MSIDNILSANLESSNINLVVLNQKTIHFLSIFTPNTHKITSKDLNKLIYAFK